MTITNPPMTCKFNLAEMWVIFWLFAHQLLDEDINFVYVVTVMFYVDQVRWITFKIN